MSGNQANPSSEASESTNTSSHSTSGDRPPAEDSLIRAMLNTTPMSPPGATANEPFDFNATYNKYKENLVKQQDLEQGIEENITKCNDQLEKQRCSLEKYTEEVAQLKAELEEMRKAMGLQSNLENMETVLTDHEKTLKGATQKIESLVKVLTEDHCKLKVKHVEMMRTKEECNRLLTLTAESSAKLEKLENAIGPLHEISELTKSLRAHKSLEEDIASKIETVQKNAEKSSHFYNAEF